MRTPRALLWLALAMLPAMASARFDPNAMRLKYVAGANYHLMGYSWVDARDVDGIAGDELLIGYRSMWQLLRWDEKAANFAQIGFHEEGYGGEFGGGGVVSVQFAQFDRGGPVQVAMLDNTGRIARFDLDGSSHTARWNPGVVFVIRMIVADIDGEPGDEVVLQTDKELSAWKYGASSPLWRMPVDDFVLIAQLDQDPQLEIALSSGKIIDSKTLQTQWRYPLGFGTRITVADVDGVRELIGCKGGNATRSTLRGRRMCGRRFCRTRRRPAR